MVQRLISVVKQTAASADYSIYECNLQQNIASYNAHLYIPVYDSFFQCDPASHCNTGVINATRV